jgi:Putative beta barrel porin-7 (BBP7)
VAVLALSLSMTASAASAQSRVSASAEYLLWWTKDGPAAPPLLSTGTLGDPDFSVALGGRDYDAGAQPGGRFSLAYRLDGDWSLEGIGFVLPTTSVTRTVSSSGAPGSVRLVIPVFRIEQGQEGRLTIASPNEFHGAARESLTSGLHGAELNVARRLAAAGSWRVDALGGIRYLRLHETLGLAAHSVALDVPDVFNVADGFGTTNRFYGAQAGVKGEYARARWFVEGSAKVAVGVMRESLDVAGTLVTNDFGALGDPQTFAGGVFAQSTNIGHHRRDRFAVVPEVGLKVGYRLTSWASLFAGYTFLYASAAARPGDQVDRRVNTTQALAFQPPQTPAPAVALDGPAHPAARLRDSEFWAQGLSVGVAFSY